IGDLDLPILHGKRLLDEVVQQRVGAEGILDNEPCWRRGGNVQPGGEGRGAGPKVRRELKIMGAGKGGNPHRLGNAAADREIRLENVDRRQHRQIAEARTWAQPALSSAVTGSSNQARLQSSTRRQKRLASATEKVPCASHI